jgi:hypothetical protein
MLTMVLLVAFDPAISRSNNNNAVALCRVLQVETNDQKKRFRFNKLRVSINHESRAASGTYSRRIL